MHNSVCLSFRTFINWMREYQWTDLHYLHYSYYLLTFITVMACMTKWLNYLKYCRPYKKCITSMYGLGLDNLLFLQYLHDFHCLFEKCGLHYIRSFPNHIHCMSCIPWLACLTYIICRFWLYGIKTWVTLPAWLLWTEFIVWHAWPLWSGLIQWSPYHSKIV